MFSLLILLYYTIPKTGSIESGISIVNNHDCLIIINHFSIFYKIVMNETTAMDQYQWHNTIIIDHITDRVCVLMYNTIHTYLSLLYKTIIFCNIITIISMCFNVNNNIKNILTSYTEWCASIVLLLLPRYRFATSSFTGHHHTTTYNIIGISTKYYYIILYYIVWVTNIFVWWKI